jgi:hypothetical protein
MNEETKIKWSYEHHLNSTSSVNRTKYGSVIKFPLWRDGKRVAAVKFDGNKGLSYIPLEEMEIVKCCKFHNRLDLKFKDDECDDPSCGLSGAGVGRWSKHRFCCEDCPEKLEEEKRVFGIIKRVPLED